jgi:RNA polymerase sigma-70 factor (ECF subfamily)
MASKDQSLDALIDLARDVSADTAKRHDAFEEVVRRFQDLAVGCACAHLRDPALAEDAAQDAFLLAWERLEQLRQPAAFPGWIRRLVLSQCHRRLRGTRLELRPEHEAESVALATNPAADAEAADDASVVSFALTQLAPADRLVLILFYGSERSQAEIADWLGVPVTTVSRRLAHAKRRMRRHTLDALAGGLRAHRKIAGEAFIVELSARLRPAKDDDVADIASLANRLGLDRVQQITIPAPPCAYLVEDSVSRTPIAYAAAEQTIFKPIYDLHLVMGEDALKRHAGDVLLPQVIQDMVASDAITLRHRTSARHGALVEFLTAREFQILERAQDWRLGPGATSPLAARTPPSGGWEFTNLEELSSNPVLFEAALELLTLASADLLSERAFLPLHPETLRRGLRTQRDGVVALVDGTLHGLLTSSADDVVPDAVRLDIVLVRRNRRGEGVATAMLARLLAKHGGATARLVAPAAQDLTAWLTRCGFVQVADTLVLERLMRKTVQVAPKVLNEYVGRYVVDTFPDTPIVIERHGDSLISKTRDMRDVLLAASESEFFTRNHYGHGRFERDAIGRIARLVCIEGPREFVAIRQ